MSELGSSAAVGIESVEWLDAGGGNLTVRVTGRWRRRRGWIGSKSGGPTTLLVESEGRRQRFPAMPEPPSLAGAAPGTWRLSFSVPAELAPALGAHAWLSLGSVIVPLPGPESAPAGGGEPTPAVTGDPASEAAEPADPASEPPGVTDAEDAAPGSLEIERAWRRADDAERVTAELDQRVADLERALQERDQRRRDAEQRAHAEEEMRRDLESTLAQARHAGEASERPAAAAQAAREQAERSLSERSSGDDLSAGGAEERRLRAEGALRARQTVGPRVPFEPPAIPAAATSAGPPSPGPAVPLGDSEVVSALRRELRARVAAEAGLRARTVQAETRLAARVLLEQRTSASLRELGAELQTLRAALDAERARRERAEAEAASLRAEIGGQRERSRDAIEAISALRGALRPPAVGEERTVDDPGAGSTSPVSPERLSDALARLREASEPRDPAPEPPSAETVGDPPAVEPVKRPAEPVIAPASGAATAAGRPTLDAAFRRAASADPARAGRLLLDLLGAQQAAYPHPVAYDLVLGPGHGCVQVTVGAGDAVVSLQGAARAREQVDFQVIGEPARLARLLTAGPLRRLLRFGVARVRGRREGLAALRALLSLPLDLDALRAAGMRAEPETLLALLAAMIDPAWTRGERFTISHTDEQERAVYLQIRDGGVPLVGRGAPEGRVATQLRGSADALAQTLSTAAGEPSATFTGDAGPLNQIRAWAKLAQCG